MFSEQFANILLSLCAGTVVGLADAFGFFRTFGALAFNPKATVSKRLTSVLWETLRLFLLAALVYLLLRWLKLSVWATVVSAVTASLVGKLFFILKIARTST